MRPFAELTHRGQKRRLGLLGKSALDEFGLAGARCIPIAHMENATFDVRSPAATRVGAECRAYSPGRYLLRVHRPGYQTAASIASELAWLEALRADAGLAVPEPVVSARGRSLVEAGARGVPQRRFCSLLRWMRGRIFGSCGQRSHHLRLVGRAMARLHEHSRSWERPEGFHRGSWDRSGLFGHAGAAGEDDSWVWSALPEREREMYEAASDRVALAMEDLGRSSETFGLIHADLHLGNVVFGDGEARVIDFDDCGFGHWVYDFAVVLHDYRTRGNYREWHDALLSGYLEVASVPADQLAYLDSFIAARCASVMIWAYSRASDNPRFREHLSEWSDWSVGFLKACGVG